MRRDSNGNGKRGAEVGERIARLESTVTSMADAIEQIARSHQRLEQLVAERMDRQTDWKSIFTAAGVVVSVIALLTALGVRELDRVDAAQLETSRKVELLATDVSTNKATAAHVFALSARINLYRDEQYRMLSMHADKLGVDVPPPTYYPPEFGTGGSP